MNMTECPGRIYQYRHQQLYPVYDSPQASNSKSEYIYHRSTYVAPATNPYQTARVIPRVIDELRYAFDAALPECEGKPQTMTYRNLPKINHILAR